MPTVAPCSVGGSFTSVEAEDVVMAFHELESCRASVAVEPAATRPVAPLPVNVWASSGDEPAARMWEGNGISCLLGFVHGGDHLTDEAIAVDGDGAAGF